jgi:hypothetical protein
MSQCNYSNLLSDYLDGHLDAQQEEDVRGHLQDPCSCDCRRELEELRSLVSSLRDLAPGVISEGGWNRLEPALQGSEAAGPASRHVLAWAASLVLGAALLAWAFQQAGSELPRVSENGENVALQQQASSLRDPQLRPYVLAAVNREELPPLQFSDEDLVSYGAELASLDSLIEAARSLPAADGDTEFQDNLHRLTSLREDLLTEMVLQAQAERTATWQ